MKLFIAKGLMLSGGVSLLVVGLIGLAHTSMGRPLMDWLYKVGCPVDFEKMDPKVVETYRQEQLSRAHGDTPAVSHPAMGFELGTTTKDDVMKWVAEEKLVCSEKRQGTVIECPVVRVENAPSVIDAKELYLQFDLEQRLIAVDLWREPTSSVHAVAHVRAIDKDLQSTVGPHTQSKGQMNGDFLAQAPLRRSAYEYRYQNYIAKISATNFGNHRVRVREHYEWMPE